MCLILFAWQPEHEYPLIVCANRDEFHHRPTAALAPWQDSPVIAGQDLQQGGTWLGITASGRFAAVTNYRRSEDMHKNFPLSRGALCRDFLESDTSPAHFLRQLENQAMATGGFNLLLSDGHTLAYASNRYPAADGGFCFHVRTELAAGLYGLSNHLLDTPWPKLTHRKNAFRHSLQHAGFFPDSSPEKNTRLKNAGNIPLKSAKLYEQALLEVLLDDSQAPDEQLPDTGIGLEQERFLSPAFIRTRMDYGTRASTILLRHRSGRQTFMEQSWHPGGQRGCRTVICPER